MVEAVEVKAAPIALLLQRGETWEEEDKLFQAIATYFRLMEYYPGTEEAQEARRRLGKLAQRFEGEGRVHQAVHLYERLAGRP